MVAEGTRRLVVDLAAIAPNWALPPAGAQQIRDAAPPGWTVHIVEAKTSSDGDGPPMPSREVMDAVVDAEAYYGFGMPEVLHAQAGALRWVHSAATGVGTSLHRGMRESSVILSNSAGIHAVPIAEYVVAGVLHFLRGLDMVVAQQHRSEWNKSSFVAMDAPLREMDTVRALIVGAGGIGGEIARRLSALGAGCTGIRRRTGVPVGPGFDRMIGLDELDAALRHHDVLVLAVPMTDATRGLMSAERLDLLPPGSIIVNVARGGLIDQGAMAARLASGQLRGAVLDVFATEPLASDDPLWQLRNALVSPHISPVSPGRFWPRQLELFLDNWRRYAAGEPLRNVVDKDAGY